MSYNSPFSGDIVQPTDVSYRSITLIADVALVWPINGGDNVAARIMDVSANVVGLSLLMPPANQASVGQDALIRNTGANAFTVKTALGQTIITIASGQSKYIYITANPDENGTWGNIAFGVGTSSPDAASLAGRGLTAISSTLNQSHPNSAIANGATFAETDRATMKVWSGGAGTVSLPAPGTLTNDWFTLIKNNGTGTLTVNVTGLGMIDGALTKQFQPQESCFIVNTGSQYLTVGYGISTAFFFSGIVNPVTSGTYNITSTNAQNLFQQFTGILTGNVTVVFPPIVNFYIISNQTTPNGYTLTVTTNTGGFSVVIPSGNQVSLVCDGTNFLNANTVQAGNVANVSLPNGTITAPALSFAAESTTGIYRPGAGQLAIDVLGSNALIASSSGVVIPNGIAGGTY